MHVRLLVAGLVAVGLSACSAPATPAQQSTAPQPEPSASASYQDDPAASVKSYGAASKECTSASAIVRNATGFTTKADAGTATQDDFDTAYAGAVSNDLPVDALPAFADLKAASHAVLGVSKTENEHLHSDFSLALSRFLNVAFKVCA